MGRSIEEFELLNTQSQLRGVAEHAFNYYRGEIPIEECQSIVDESYALLGESAVIKHHLVALADRWSIERLRRIGILQRGLAHSAHEVLFVDVDDSGLAAAAATLLNSYGRGRVQASSAGQQPAPATNPVLVRVAADTGVDLSEAFPKAVTQEALQVADVIVTLGQAVADPDAVSVPEHHDRDLSTTGRQRMMHWDLPDLDLREPTEDAVRTVLNTLDRRALTLLADLLTADDAAVDQTQPA